MKRKKRKKKKYTYTLFAPFQSGIRIFALRETTCRRDEEKFQRETEKEKERDRFNKFESKRKRGRERYVSQVGQFLMIFDVRGDTSR